MEKERLTASEVKEYLARINYKGPVKSTFEALTELQRCHKLSVPFENLSVFGKEEIIISKDWLFDKVVRRERGGLCYELNSLYSLLLDHFGLITLSLQVQCSTATGEIVKECFLII